MKKLIAIALAAALFMTPLAETAQALETVRRDHNQIKQETEGRGRSRRRRRHGGGSGGWVAAGILGAALVGTAIASSSSKPRHYYQEPTYVYPSSPTYVYPSTTTYVYPSTTTYAAPSAPVVVDPNVYTYDANGNLVPYYPQY